MSQSQKQKHVGSKGLAEELRTVPQLAMQRKLLEDQSDPTCRGVPRVEVELKWNWSGIGVGIKVELDWNY